MALIKFVVFCLFFPHLERSRDSYICLVFWLASTDSFTHFSGEAIVNSIFLIEGSGVSFSPKCSPKAVPPRIKNATSAPSCDAKSKSSFVERFRFHNSLRPFKVAAASEDAPPSPAAIGMFFFIVIWADFWIL